MKPAKDIGVAIVARELRKHIGDWGFNTVVDALAHVALEYDEEQEPEGRDDMYKDFAAELNKLTPP